LQDITAIPLSALCGDNIISRSERTPWYQGPTLMAYLETCEVDVSRTNVIFAADAPAEVADQFECHIVWMAEQPMFVGRPYQLKIGAQLLKMTITALKHKVNVNTLEHVAATELALNEIAVCNISLDRAVAFEPYTVNREMGGFILIDCQTQQTVGAGMLHFALRRSQNIRHQHFDIDMAARATQKGQAPVVLWFTGLSGAGKSTIANQVEQQLFAMGRHSYLLDGDNVRHGLNRDLGFTDADRVENIRRVSEVARLMIDSGLIVLAAFISPFRAERIQAQQTIGEAKFYEIYIDTPLAVAEQRDVKGLYKKARSGQLKNFTGIDSPYEIPAAPSLTVYTENETAEQSATKVVAFLKENGLV
jgi:bifunctional enzyme CysN/CysC